MISVSAAMQLVTAAAASKIRMLQLKSKQSITALVFWRTAWQRSFAMSETHSQHGQMSTLTG
jgi:hypothetical protein